MTTLHDRNVLRAILNPLAPTQDIDELRETEPDAPVEHEHYEEARRLECEGVLLAEKKEHEVAIRFFTQAIKTCPIAPSPYNNRAQALRLAEQPAEALADLAKAIELSGGKGRTACQAFTQRAMIHRLQGDDDKARADFTAAASLGSQYARMQLVSMNPYAAMCNQMLSQVMAELKAPASSSNKPGECSGK